MIISRTPFRLSFFGGGTDYPVYYQEHGGSVLGTTINKYCYISCRHLPPFFDYKSRIIYSKMEVVNDIDDINHPSVRETFRFMNVKEGIELHHDGDLPARSGLGSSSSFTVGLLHVLYAFRGTMPSKKRLAEDAIHIEQKMIPENVGSQDQTLAAFGGFNRIDFSSGDPSTRITPVIVPTPRYDELQNHLMLFFTGFARNSSDVAKVQVAITPKKIKELKIMHQMVDAAVGILTSSGDIKDFGKLLHESWRIKRSLTDKISSPAIDQIYETARSAGALGGKILGAGGGGFMVLFVPPSKQPKVKAALKGILHVPFRFGKSGSEIIFYDRDMINTESPREKKVLVTQER